jgi:two-component system chemotaxis sensor kinase CheA
MSELQEAAKEFLIESHENLDQLDTDLVGLEQAATPGPALGRIFRTLHTIKGSCSFLGFPHLEAVAHAGENLLGKLRDGKLALSPAIMDALLQMVDAIRQLLARIESTGDDGDAADRDLIGRLNTLASSQPVVAGTSKAGDKLTDPVSSAAASSFALAETVARPAAAAGPAPDHDAPPLVESREPPTTPAPESARPGASSFRSAPTFVASAESSALKPAPESARAGDSSFRSAPTFVASAESSPLADSSAVYDASIRIHVDVLDKLMTLAGEIVLARNQILQYSQQHGDPAFQNTCRQLNLITTELQEHVMKTRLQPMGNVWNRFPRLVRDTAAACGKKVRLETEGSETELDKTLIEAIRDPLTHLVRNAIDHGLEPPERRLATGKPAEGCVRLRAYHEGGQVNVEVSDDGGGIDPERVKHRAIEQRLLTLEQASRMGTQTLLGLIFLPGFSTAASVTTLSGRGVGMDVVKTNIEKIGGSVDVQSSVGQGTTVRLRIPLTLAIIKVLVVTSAGDRYAIPQVSIVELVRVEGAKARKGIQRVHGVLIYRYRDRLLPLVNLNQVLQLEGNRTDEEAVNIVVLQAADRQFGLVVDGINDTQEIVVKPLWKHLKSLACFAGATVMGDGRVALILDVFGLAQRAGAASHLQGWTVAETQAAEARPAQRPSVLLVEGRDRGRKAIPLSQVARLEEFPRARLERVADRQVVQYCGQILPLLDLDAVLDSLPESTPSSGAEVAPAREAVQVVVYARPERPVGLIVERILDIVERDSDVQGPPSRPGVECTAVIQGRVTELLDIEALIRSTGER